MKKWSVEKEEHEDFHLSCTLFVGRYWLKVTRTLLIRRPCPCCLTHMLPVVNSIQLHLHVPCSVLIVILACSWGLSLFDCYAGLLVFSCLLCPFAYLVPCSNTSWFLVLFHIFCFPPPSVMQAQQGFGLMLVSLLFCDHS